MNQNLINDLTIKILESPNEIINHLQIGISIPLLPDLYKFILHDLNYFNAKSIILLEKGIPIGHSLIYDDGDNTLYFGYFRVLGHEKEKISYLIEKVINYAQNNGFKFIRGPINIPAYIYGWGFMKKGSKEDLFIGKPVNPTIYQELFLEKGFYVKYEENTWEGPVPLFNPWKLKNYDFTEYEFFTPKDLNELMKLKKDFLKLYASSMPPSSRITPSVGDFFENIAKFVLKYGDFFMINLVRYKSTGDIVACGSWLPNPFRKNKKGNYDSFVAFSLMVDAAHRRKGLLMLMIGETTKQAWKNEIQIVSVPTGSDNIGVNTVTELVGLTHTRTHLIIEFKI